MRVLVGVKRVVDYAVKVRVAGDKSGVDLNNIKMSMNPFCEIAVEEAVRLKEKKIATEIVSVSIGPKACVETLRTSFAMGVDKGIHIVTDARTDQAVQPLTIAKALEFIAKRDNFDVVMLGKQAIDGDNCQTGPMVAGLLDWPQCTFAAELKFDGAACNGERETDAGTENISFPLPAVITTDLRLNTPRFATLPNIMKAKKKAIETLELGAVVSEENQAPHNVVVSVEEPPARVGGKLVADVDDLLQKLKGEAGVI